MVLEKITGSEILQSSKALVRTLTIIVCLLASTSPSVSQTVETQRDAASQALIDGDPALTARLAQEILSKTPDDFPTLFILSQAQTELGQDSAAAASAKHAYRAARTDEEKLQASRLAAAAKFNLGQFTRAEWWLRRGANHTDTPEEVASIAREFQAIRQKNPLSIKLGFSIAPSNNINGGTEDSTFSLGEFDFIFDPSSRSLSGVEYAGDVDVSYRLSQGPTHATYAGLYLFGRTYALSSSSREAAPGISGRDYALGLAEVSLSHQRALFEGLGPSGISLHAGQVWYGGDPLWRYQKLALSQGIRLGQSASASLQLSAEDQEGLRADQPDTKVIDLQANYARRLENQNVVRLSLNSRQNKADTATNTFTDHRATLSYDLARTILENRVSASLTAGKKTYDEFSLSLDGRRDRYVSVGVSATLEQVSYFGFSPNWSVSVTRTNSNVTRFSTLEVTGRLGVQSNF